MFLFYMADLSHTTLHASNRVDFDTLTALYLYQFANFVTWPKSSFKNRTSPIRYCIGDDGPLVNLLPKVIENQRVKGRLLIYESITLRQTEELNRCHLLFLHKSYKLNDFLQNINHSTILTVSDNSEFLKEGGAIALVKKGKNIKPMINIGLIEKKEIKVSAKLLRLSIIYK